MAVDAAAFTDYAEATLRAQADRLAQLRDVFTEKLSEDLDSREEILKDLEEIRIRFREAGHPEIEDVVLEAMDFVAGWCSPHMKA